MAQVDPKTLINKTLNDFLKKAHRRQNQSTFSVATENTAADLSECDAQSKFERH